MRNKTTPQLRLFIAMLLLAGNGFSQSESGKSFTLKEAQDYAVKNNVNVLNANLDDEIAKNYNKEIRGIGFPQINGSFDLKDFIEIPTSLIPAQFFGGPEGSYAPVKFGTKYNATAGLSASQIIFSSDYFLALKASKALLELSQKNSERTKVETQVAVAKAYYAVLVFRKQLKLLESNIELLRKYSDETKAYYDNGFVEKIDMERNELSYNNAIIDKENVERAVQLTEYTLKFQMGMEIATPITLTDSLDLNAPINAEINFGGKTNYSARVEYQLLQNQDRLNHLELKRYRLNYLPSIAAYGSLSTQAQRAEFDIFDTKKGWYPTAELLGQLLNLPIFDGFQKHYKSQQAKLKIQKTQNSYQQFRKC
jgi:outer membrane protein